METTVSENCIWSSSENVKHLYSQSVVHSFFSIIIKKKKIATYENTFVIRNMSTDITVPIAQKLSNPEILPLI